MVFYTDFCWSKTLKGKKWHKFLDFSISEEAAVTSTIIIMTRIKVTYGLTRIRKFEKTISTQSRWCRSNLLGIQLFLSSSGHHFNFHFHYSTSCGNRPGNSSLLLPNKEEPNKERTLTTKAFVNEIWNGKVAWLSLMKPTVKPPPPPQFVNDSLWLWKYFWT